MAIYSSVPPPEQQGPTLAATLTPLIAEVELPIRGTGVTLSIPLDVSPLAKEARPRKEPLRRDSLKRREALLRGKEGSRRRQRWENGTLIPPLPPFIPYPWHEC
jgi:hypothetical protein